MKIHHFFVSFLFIICLVLCFSCQKQPEIIPINETEEYKTYIYKSIDTIDLTVNVYYPNNYRKGRKYPAIVFYFGGGWRIGSPGHFHNHAKYLASRGMICFCADYRTKSKHGNSPIECIMDARSAMRWVKANAKALGVDKNRVVASGGSAGGHLAACQAVDIDFNDPQDDLSISTMPNLLVLFNPVINTHDWEDKYRERFGEHYKAASPHLHLGDNCPPCIIFNGTKDKATLFKYAVKFEEKMKKLGNECELKAYTGQGHGFFNYYGSANKYFIETLYETDMFLQKHGYLKGPQTILNIYPLNQAGEATSESVIIQSRFCLTDTLVQSNIAGTEGFGKLYLADNMNFDSAYISGLQVAMDEKDNIIKWKCSKLKSGTKYYYKIAYSKDSLDFEFTDVGTFKTLYGIESDEEVQFVMVTGSNYEWFYLKDTEFWKHHENDSMEKELHEYYDYVNLDKNGFPTFLTILDKKPDFYIGNGDNVYYDQPWEFAAKNLYDMRANWHRLFSMPNCQKMLKEIPVFWMKDDHDHRYNDCDTTAGRLPGNKLGLEVFSEQLPYPKYPVDKPYRTYRLNKHLQIWMLEGRDYRSPNNLPDNHKKSIWGEEQLKWLKKTMLESDATFKLLVSPTPMIGPDDAYKSDNHCNTGGFITERDNFFDWLEDNNVDESGFYIICGDRHWQYHSIHPTGIEEFSCGAMIDENSRLGRKPGDPKSNDPLSLIEQKYTQKNAGGGFLEVIQFNHYEQPTLKFVFHDTKGKVLYQVKYKKK